MYLCWNVKVAVNCLSKCTGERKCSTKYIYVIFNFDTGFGFGFGCGFGFGSDTQEALYRAWNEM